MRGCRVLEFNAFRFDMCSEALKMKNDAMRYQRHTFGGLLDILCGGALVITKDQSFIYSSEGKENVWNQEI